MDDLEERLAGLAEELLWRARSFQLPACRVTCSPGPHRLRFATLCTLLYALRAGRVRRFSTLLAGIALVAQIDAKRCIDREFDLAVAWSLAAPAGWVVFGILVADVAYRILSGRGTEWKGRQLPKQGESFSDRGDIISL